MGKMSLSILCLVIALAVPTSAYSRGGTPYRHAEPYFVHPDRHKTHNWAPVIVYSSEHHHYHETYHPRYGESPRR